MKEEIGFRQFNLNPKFLQKLEDYQAKNFKTVKPFEVAKAILHQSDYYIKNPEGRTPWSDAAIQMAQIFYYLPLNYLRNLAVASEIASLYPELKQKRVFDFGAGLGAASIAIDEILSPQKLLAIEISTTAIELQNKMNLIENIEYLNELPYHIEKDSIGWFSYSLTEVINPMPLLVPFDHIVIVEPSTQRDSQKLIGIREELLANGFEILAPCTHQNKCPLQNNRSDWCHDKIKTELSTNMLGIESHMKIKNSDLTFSYLVASRSLKSKTIGKIRMIGDPQFEKGKTRQMICRGENREFFSWLDRDKYFSQIARGVLVDLPAKVEEKGAELRIKEAISLKP